MTSRFQQLHAEGRVALAALKLQGHSLRHIAKQLGRSPSPLSHEVRRDASGAACNSAQAHKRFEQRRRAACSRAKLCSGGSLWPVVGHMLGWYWSPQQIARTRRAFWPDEPSMHVSHETIYIAIYAHAKTGQGLVRSPAPGPQHPPSTLCG